MDKQADDSAFFSPQGVTKCQNIETILSQMAMAQSISEHMLTSWSSFNMEPPKWVIGKQCRPRSNAAECSIWSGLHCLQIVKPFFYRNI